MSEIDNLATNLGLGTNNRFVNQMPFAKAANTELSMAIQNKKEEQRIAAEEAKKRQAIASRIKGGWRDVDSFGQPVLKEAFISVINSGDDPITREDYYAKLEKEKTETKALESISNTADKMLLPQDIKDAYKKRDYQYIIQKSKENPNLGITISETGRPLLDPSKIVADVNIDDYFKGLTKEYSKNEGMWLPTSKSKKEFGRVYQQAILKPEIYQQEAERIFTTNPNQSPEEQALERNYLVKRQKDIEVEMANPKYANIASPEEKLITAAKNVFIKEAQNKVVNSIENKVTRPRSEDKEYRWSGNTFTNGKGNSWTYTYDPNTKAIGVNTVGNTGVSPQGLLLARKSTNKQGVEKIDSPDYADVKIMAITPIGNNTWEVTAKEDGIPVKGIATDEALTSYMSNFPAEKIREGYKARVGGFPVQTPNIEVSQAPKSNWGSPIKEAPKAESNKQTKTVNKVQGKKDDNL